MSPRPAICDMMDRIVSERRGELRRLDLLAHGIELDLDPAGLQALGQAPDHDDILAKLKIPDQYLAPIWTEWHYARPCGSHGLPHAIASAGRVHGQATIDQARAEADRVREILVEVARLKITGQVEELAASLPPYEPGSLDWHEAVSRSFSASKGCGGKESQWCHSTTDRTLLTGVPAAQDPLHRPCFRGK